MISQPTDAERVFQEAFEQVSIPLISSPWLFMTEQHVIEDLSSLSNTFQHMFFATVSYNDISEGGTHLTRCFPVKGSKCFQPFLAWFNLVFNSC